MQQIMWLDQQVQQSLPIGSQAYFVLYVHARLSFLVRAGNLNLETEAGYE